MLKIIFIISIIMVIGISTNYAHSQEIGLSTFQESAQVIIDKKISNTSIASITLHSSNLQEIKIPTELEQKIRENERVQAVVITNQNNCVLGVRDYESCIIINIERNPEDKGIIAIQESTRRIADLYIEEINQVFDTDAKFFQVFIHTDDKTNQQLKTSGIVSGQGIIAAVYTMPMENTDSMYEKLSSMLLSKSIRDGEGFYNIAKTLSSDENAKMSFSLIPSDTKSLLQLRLSVENSNQIEEEVSAEISPLQFFNIENLERSDYFSSGNYPLNSLFQIVILSNEETNISNVKGNIIESTMIDGIKIPNQITKNGWIFDPDQGEQIQGKYIFGEKTSINKNDLKFSLGGNNIQFNESEFDESTIVIIIIVIVSVGVAVFYLKGYKK